MELIMKNIKYKLLVSAIFALSYLATLQNAVAAADVILCQGVGQVPIPCNMGPTATTDISATISIGGTFQIAAAASLVRNSIEIENNCSISGSCVSVADNCYVYVGQLSADKKKSILIPPGGYYLRSSGSIPSDAIQVTCDSSGDILMIKVQ